MTYQHAILPSGARLELRVEPELYGRWLVAYRVAAPGFAHKDDWRTVEHCEAAELLDVAIAVVEGFLGDFEAQGLF